MEALILARIQFAFTAGFHFIFPPTTLGLTTVIVVVESLFLKTGREHYRRLSGFLVKLLALVFVLGTATGIVLEFAFGNNWAEYSKMVGDIFGAPLAAEAIFAFFLESVFLGILVFGREKVSGRFYWISALLVWFGAHLSGLWIIIANSWMQTPAGYTIVSEGGQRKAILTDFFAAVFNPSTVERYVHTIVAGWITGTLLLAAIAAWYLLKNRCRDVAGTLLRVSLLLFIVTAVGQFFTGHMHSVQVAKTQPEKIAAFEALWETQKGAPLVNFGIPDEEEERTHFLFEFPRMLSFLVYGDVNAEMKGLKDFPENERPPVLLSFAMYHLMVFLGVWFALLAVISLYLWIRGRYLTTRWFLYLLIISAPLPYLANEFGWIAAEVGRQPWVVYRVMRTSEAVSRVVPAGNILASLILFVLVYGLLFWVFIRVMRRIIRKGPESLTPQGY